MDNNISPIPISPIPSTAEDVCVGIDVAKAKLDVCLLNGQGTTFHRRFTNTADGFSELLAWTKQLAGASSCHFALEATGPYSDALATFLFDAGLRISLLNPARVRYAALAAGEDNKTDKADARTIAHYCRKENPPCWIAPSPELRKLTDLVRRREDLLEMLQKEKNRQEQSCIDKEVQRSLGRVLRAIAKEVQRVEKALCQHIHSHPKLAADAALLESIPGISAITAQKILAELGGDAKRFSCSSAAAAYAGLSPREHKSGSSVRKKTTLSKRGNPFLRKAMYFPTVTALTHNPRIKDFYERLVACGKRKMVALGAAMRKLLMIAVGVLRSGKPFDPTWTEKQQQGQKAGSPPPPPLPLVCTPAGT